MVAWSFSFYRNYIFFLSISSSTYSVVSEQLWITGEGYPSAAHPREESSKLSAPNRSLLTSHSSQHPTPSELVMQGDVAMFFARYSNCSGTMSQKLKAEDPAPCCYLYLLNKCTFFFHIAGIKLSRRKWEMSLITEWKVVFC